MKVDNGTEEVSYHHISTRFHALYDRIFRLDILWQAWKEVRENKGSAGIDGILN